MPGSLQVRKGNQVLSELRANLLQARFPRVNLGLAEVLREQTYEPVVQAPPNPSIERDVQGLSPSAAPHVKRWAAASWRSR